MSESLERIRARALEVVSPLRSAYSAEMLQRAVDHILMNDTGSRYAVPLQGLSSELRGCVCLCAVYLQREVNRVNGTDNPTVLIGRGENA